MVRRLFLSPFLPEPRLRRLGQLYLGLCLCGLGLAMQVAAHLGAAPWDVLHQGLFLNMGGSIGGWSIVVGIFVVLLWIPLRQQPGIGTLSNIVLVGLSFDVALALLPEPVLLPLRSTLLMGGILVTGLGSGLYIGARLGPGPRDGVMTGLAARGLSIRTARTLIEAVVVVVGFLLGGTVGVGTLLFALAIGPVTQPFLQWFDVEARHRVPAPPPGVAGEPVIG
jgi:uncharacterized membrane protein YczE